MRKLLLTTLLTAVMVSGISLFGEQISVGVRIGAPPPPRVVAVRPPIPGPEFVWIDGYWYGMGGITSGTTAIGPGHRIPVLSG